MKKVELIIRRVLALIMTALCISMPVTEIINGSKPHVVAVVGVMAFLLWTAGMVAATNGVE